ncbi:Protein R11.1, partial [Aphelenchoides avenae]
GLSVAGLCSGLTEAVVICPFEVVKVRLQSEHNVAVKDQKSTMATAREIVRQNGFGTTGIYRGLGATMYRQAVWNMVYFGVYHSIKHLIPDGKENPGANLGLRLLLGFAAGTLASIANIPFDVAKSRIQGPQPAAGRIYHTTWQTVILVRRQEGFKTLYRGLVPKVMRLGPGGAIMIVVYETIYDFLKKNT